MELTEDYIFEFKDEYFKKKIDDYYVVIFNNTHKYIVLDNEKNKWFELLANEKNIGYVYTEFDLEKKEDEYLEFLSDLYWALIKNEKLEKNNKISLKLDITYRCNTNCSHCFLPDFPNMNELDITGWKRICNKFFNALDYKPEIALSGGEALIMNPMLKELITYIRPYVENITLLTNGYVFSEWIEGRNRELDFYLENVDFYQISLDGFDKKTYDSIRGNGKFEKVLKTIRYLNSLNKPVEYHTTISKENMEMIERNFVSFVNSNNIYRSELNHFSFSIVQPFGNAKKIQDRGNICSKLEYEKFLFRLQNKINEAYPPKFVDKNKTVNNTICSVGNQISISPNGMCYLCGVALGEPICNALEDDVKEILEKFANIREQLDQKNIEECKKCELKGICLGKCRVNNKRRTGSYVNVNCNEEMKEELYRTLVREEILGVPY